MNILKIQTQICIRTFAAATLITFLFGCTANQPDPELLMTNAVNAVNNSARSDADRQLDDRRKPAEVLAFFQVQPGMRVLDVFGGGGYYTEIASYLVGPEGSVTLYNNSPWDNFVTKQVNARLDSGRLANVKSLTAPPEAFIQKDQEYDAAIFILGMHDIYHEDLANGWPAIDTGKFLNDIYRSLKPGGILGVIDHNAKSGTDAAEVGSLLHRIDPQKIISDLEAAGFRLESQSGILRNPDDNLQELVFKPELRWKTDRSVLRFRKQ